MASTTKKKATTRRVRSKKNETAEQEVVSTAASGTTEAGASQEPVPDNDENKPVPDKWQMFTPDPCTIYLQGNAVRLKEGWNYIDLNDYGSSDDEIRSAVAEANAEILYLSKIEY